MIEVSHIKTYGGKVPEDTLLVESDADYVRACRSVVEKVGSPAPIKVWVRQKSHYAWLRSFTEQINITCTFSEKTPRLILEGEWKVTIPEWLDDETVTSQKLLDLSPGEEHPARFEDTLLVLFLGQAFHADKLGTNNFSDVVAAVTRPDVTEHFNAYPVLERCLQEKSKAWMRRTNQPWVKEVCADLSNDRDNLWKELTLWCLLSGYPEKLLDYVVPPHRATFLRNVPLEVVEELPLHLVAVDQASTQIKMFFKDIHSSIKSGTDFRDVLKCVSGRLVKEFRFITELLGSNQFEVLPEDLDLVRNKFRTCPGISAAKLASLDRFVVPERPSLPQKDEQWKADRWIRWTLNEYIPYRHWQTQNRYYDPEVEEVVRGFSEWYVKEYAAIHQDPEKSLVHLLGQWKNWIKRDVLSLVLLVDCLPLTFWGLLQEELAKAGFHKHETSNRFVPLPSHTEHSKPVLLSGTWESIGKSYESILQERSENDWGGRRVIYLPNLKALSELPPPKEATLVLLNFLPSDEVLHSDVELKNSTYEEELYRLFARLADSARNLLEKWQGLSEQFSVYVITDHGASRILEEEKESFDSKVIKKLFPNERHRFSCVNKAEIESIPENLWELGYRFNQPFSHDDRVYFIPCGHNTVRALSSAQSYVHGGASPEEVIVRAAIFKPIEAAWKELAVRFLKLKIDQASGKAIFYIQRVVPLQIEVQNPNNEAIRVIRVDVLSPDTDIKGCTTPSIPGNGHADVEVDCYFNKPAQGQEEVVLQLTYEIAGEEHIKELKAAAEFKSAVTGGFSLKDLR